MLWWGAAAGPDADLSIFDGHELHVVDAGETLTFEHTYTWWGESPYLSRPLSVNLEIESPSLNGRYAPHLAQQTISCAATASRRVLQLLDLILTDA